MLFKELDLTPSLLAKLALAHLKVFARLTFVVGPRVLLTSHISKSCASMMAVLTAPALVLTSLITVPGYLFTDPEQNTYFYFAKSFQLDFPTLTVMLLTVGCTLFALSLPAIEEPPKPEASPI